MRVFLGTPMEATPALEGLLADLEASGADLKVVPAENLHVTYKFLGETDASQVAVLTEALREAAFPPAFDVEVHDVGVFPDWNNMRILWVGVADEEGMLAKVARTIEETTAQLGWSREDRAFTAHATVARTRSSRGLEHAKRVMEGARGKRFGTLRVDHVAVVQSILSSEGATYQDVGRINL